MSASEFPRYVVDSVDGYLEESHQSTVLDVIRSFMTSKRYPPASLLHTIMENLLVRFVRFTEHHVVVCGFSCATRYKLFCCTVKHAVQLFECSITRRHPALTVSVFS